MGKVMEKTTILENPATPGQGILVAAGDEVPPYAYGYIENTPNKVDAARNHDVADAADQAAPPRIRDGAVIQRDPEAAKAAEEAAARVGANRDEFDQRQRDLLDPQGWLPRGDFDGPTQPSSSSSRSSEAAKTEEQGDTPKDVPLEKLTVAQLDRLAETLGDGKPDEYAGNKADKVKALGGKVTQAQINAAAEEG